VEQRSEEEPRKPTGELERLLRTQDPGSFCTSPTQAEVQALRDKTELADDVRALSALVHALRGALVAEGLMKGGV
jgi:hypothetical protein